MHDKCLLFYILLNKYPMTEQLQEHSWRSSLEIYTCPQCHQCLEHHIEIPLHVHLLLHNKAKGHVLINKCSAIDFFTSLICSIWKCCSLCSFSSCIHLLLAINAINLKTSTWDFSYRSISHYFAGSQMEEGLYLQLKQTFVSQTAA